MRRANSLAANTEHRRVWFLLLCSMVLAVAALSSAAGPYQIDWHTIDGGGGTSAGGLYILTGTIGQPDADWSRGGKYELLAGFWPGGPLCIVEFDDFARFAEQWFLSGSGLPADLDGDNDVDFDDLSRLSDYWLGGCPYNWALK